MGTYRESSPPSLPRYGSPQNPELRRSKNDSRDGHAPGLSTTARRASRASDVVNTPMIASPSRTGKLPILRSRSRRAAAAIGISGAAVTGPSVMIRLTGCVEQVGGKVPGEQAPKVPIRDDTDQAVAVDDQEMANPGVAHPSERGANRAVDRDGFRQVSHPVPHRPEAPRHAHLRLACAAPTAL